MLLLKFLRPALRIELVRPLKIVAHFRRYDKIRNRDAAYPQQEFGFDGKESKICKMTLQIPLTNFHHGLKKTLNRYPRADTRDTLKFKL